MMEEEESQRPNVSILTRAKDFLTNILAYIFIAIFFILGWLVTAWLYPDEWFAQIPILLLKLIGLK